MSSNSDNATTLAKNKVLILYVLNLINNDIKQDDLFKIITDINDINYFYFKQVLTDLIDSKLVGSNTKEEEQTHIINSIPIMKDKIEKLVPEGNYDINYGLNYFPEKTYEGKTYPAGEYESLVITLGSGEGDNFWCILFPPLCMIDEEVEYKSFIKESLSKFF